MLINMTYFSGSVYRWWPSQMVAITDGGHHMGNERSTLPGTKNNDNDGNNHSNGLKMVIMAQLAGL